MAYCQIDKTKYVTYIYKCSSAIVRYLEQLATEWEVKAWNVPTSLTLEYAVKDLDTHNFNPILCIKVKKQPSGIAKFNIFASVIASARNKIQAFYLSAKLELLVR